LIVLDSATNMLAVLVLMAHFPLREANAIKVFSLGLVALLLGVILFTVKGQIDWPWAIPLAAGAMAGSRVGARSRPRGPGCHGPVRRHRENLLNQPDPDRGEPVGRRWLPHSPLRRSRFDYASGGYVASVSTVRLVHCSATDVPGLPESVAAS
jgi:hypothetical protein